MKIKQVTVSRKLQAEFQSGELEERLEADEFLIRRERTFISAGPNWPSTRAGRHALFFLRRLLPGGGDLDAALLRPGWPRSEQQFSKQH